MIAIRVPAEELRPGDRAHMYRTVVEITGDPYYEPGLREEYVRVPMIWAGIRCAPPEQRDQLIAIQRPEQP